MRRHRRADRCRASTRKAPTGEKRAALIGPAHAALQNGWIATGVAILLTLMSVSAGAQTTSGTRIISLSPGLTELVYAAGAGQYLVGVSAYSDYPAAASALPTVGDAFHVDMERLVALSPTLVLVWASASPPDLIRRLRELGYETVVFEPRSLKNIAHNLRRIGALAGTSEQADLAADAVERSLEQLRARYAEKTPVSVFFQVMSNPLYTINGKQIISQGIRLCGGRNVFANLPTLAATVSIASVIARDPEAIITGKRDNEDTPLKMWRRWPELAAVRNDALISVPVSQITRATPRMLEGVEKICRALDRVRRSEAD